MQNIKDLLFLKYKHKELTILYKVGPNLKSGQVDLTIRDHPFKSWTRCPDTRRVLPWKWLVKVLTRLFWNGTVRHD